MSKIFDAIVITLLCALFVAAAMIDDTQEPQRNVKTGINPAVWVLIGGLTR